MSVFVSIAAYRDPELMPTVLDCLARAQDPDGLRIVVCRQHGDEDVPELRADPRVELIDVPYREARGACWARAEIMKRYAGEEFFAQFDSHTRFAPDWDATLIKAAAATGAAKPLLTTYPPGYEPDRPDERGSAPTGMVLARFDADGIPLFKPRFLAAPENLTAPVPARFASANFLFAPGSFVTEVPYDPQLYFIGEEITLALRAWTWGYDLFHPHEVVVWHYYLRDDRPKHWEDHLDTAAGKAWWQRDRASRRRVSALLRFPEVGHMSCGPNRTAAAYQEFAGIDFRQRTFVSDWL